MGERITLYMNLPPPYEVSSLHQQRRDKGIIWWVVWVCQPQPPDYSFCKYFGRGEDRNLDQAVQKAINSSKAFRDEYEHKLLPKPTHAPVSDEKLEDLF